MNGIVYCAYGDKYLAEVERSIESVEKHCQLPIFVIKDGDLLDAPALINKPWVLLRGKIPFEQFLFLDTDTVILDDITPVFQILELFDIAACHAWLRSGFMPRLSSGVILMKNNQDFLREWSKATLEYWRATGINDDQPGFTDIFYSSSLRQFILPPEFNLRIYNKIYVSGRAYILHGRYDRLTAAVEGINSSEEPRVWDGRKRNVDIIERT